MFRLRAAHGRLHLASSRPASLHARRLNIPPPPILPLTTTWTVQARGKKTSSSVKIIDLPQGRVDSAPSPSPSPSVDEHNDPAYPTVILQARRNMDRYADCVLLTRVGGFYELYFEHAEEYAPLLNIKLSSKKTNAGPVPMAGFPFFQLDRFLKVLLQDLNRHVAISEEFPNTAADKIKSGGLMHDRKVARIITPGTLIDENFMDPYTNNYVMAIHIGQDSREPEPESKPRSKSRSKAKTKLESAEPTMSQELSPLLNAASTPLGLAWLDLSTGHFFTQSATMSSLPNILSRISPREIVLEQGLESRKNHDIFSILADDRHFITFSEQGGLADISEWAPFLESKPSASTMKAFSEEEIVAGGLVLDYVRDRLQGTSMKLQPPLRYENLKTVSIDKNSLRALEIKQTIRDGVFRGSLLHAIRRTVTKSGARLLSEWLGAPSTSLDVIRARQDTVARFIDSSDLREAIIILLRRSNDSQRLVQKFALGRGDPDDLLGIASTIRAAEDIVNLLKAASTSTSSEDSESPDCLAALASRIDLKEPIKLAAKIKKSIDEEGIVHQQEVKDSEASRMMALAEKMVSSEESQEDAASQPRAGRKKPTSIKEHYAEDNESWIMKPGASRQLKKLHEQLESLQEERVELTDTLRGRLQAATLTLRWSPGLGHIAHIKGKDTKNISDVKTLSSSRSTRSFHIAEWTDLGQRLDQVHFGIRREEQVVFQTLREQVVLNLVKLRRIAAVLDELDIATSFAKLAIEQNLIRPALNDSTQHTIIGGRHPTVERGLLEQGRSFIRNDCFIGSPSSGSLWLITGPNMAGKSTFLRQNVLITILAQIGCYVPAVFAEIGIVDAIFSRVGSADNLYHDQSTFMVEMLETAQILKQATPRSLVIMDEIGRGTTPEDGTAVSFACLHHLVTVNQCRTLFATHFHDVADMASAEGFCHPTSGPVQMYCTDVQEDGQGGFVYIHKLRRGINRQSHALKVARLAGLPEHAIDVAKRVLTSTPEKIRESASTG